MSLLGSTPWPTPAERQRCERVWSNATLDERCRMTRLQGHGVARRVSVAATLLKMKAAKIPDIVFAPESPEKLHLPLKRCEAVACESGMEHILFRDQCTLAQLTPSFCARGDGLAFMLGKAVKTQADHIAVMQKMADSHLSLVTSEGYHLDAASASWEALATNVFTLLVTALLMRCSDDAAMQKALLRSLTMSTEAKLRSWPSKKELEMLHEYWATRTDEERVVLTTLQGPRMWWVHNCDYVLAAREVRDVITVLLPRAGVQRMVEDEAACRKFLDNCRRSVGLEHFAGLEDNGGSERMFFTEDFFRGPNALSRIVKNAMQQSSSRKELLALVDAATCPFELSSAAYQLIVENRLTPMPTWKDLATVVYTLVLDSIMVRCENCHALEAMLRQRGLQVEDTKREMVARREEKLRRKRRIRAGAEKLAVARLQETPRRLAREDDVDAARGAESGKFLEPSAESGGGTSRERWREVVLPFHRWFVRNTFIDVDDCDAEIVMPRRSRSCEGV